MAPLNVSERDFSRAYAVKEIAHDARLAFRADHRRVYIKIHVGWTMENFSLVMRNRDVRNRVFAVDDVFFAKFAVLSAQADFAAAPVSQTVSESGSCALASV